MENDSQKPDDVDPRAKEEDFAAMTAAIRRFMRHSDTGESWTGTISSTPPAGDSADKQDGDSPMPE